MRVVAVIVRRARVECDSPPADYASFVDFGVGVDSTGTHLSNTVPLEYFVPNPTVDRLEPEEIGRVDPDVRHVALER